MCFGVPCLGPCAGPKILYIYIKALVQDPNKRCSQRHVPVRHASSKLLGPFLQTPFLMSQVCLASCRCIAILYFAISETDTLWAGVPAKQACPRAAMSPTMDSPA